MRRVTDDRRQPPRAAWIALFAACAWLLAAAAPALADHPLLPDLRTKEPERLSITTSNGERRLRFDNEVGNASHRPARAGRQRRLRL